MFAIFKFFYHDFLKEILIQWSSGQDILYDRT